MFKLMIADDNPYFLKDLKECIDWEIFDFELVGAYKDGKELLDAAVANMPDLVITDVSMPVMDGFELSSQLYKRNPNITIIFISGYSEFHYAQEALKLGIFDYILKPISNTRLLSCMDKVHKKLLQEQLLRLEQISSHSQRDYYRKIALSHYIGSLMFCADNEAQIKKNLSQLEYYHVDSTQHYVAYFSFSPYSATDAANESAELNADLLQLLLESNTTDIQIIPTLIRKGTGVFLLSCSEPSIKIYDLFSALCIDMEVNMNIRINIGYSGPCESFTELPALYRHAQQIHSQLLITSPIVPIASSKDFPMDSSEHAEAIDAKPNSASSYSSNVAKIREYIEANYAKHITTNDVARNVFLSAGYANTCFSDECGTSIFNYIIQLRMEKASQLLREGNLPVAVIAERVGYSNKTSFYLAFKRYTGVSPSTYRAQAEDTP